MAKVNKLFEGLNNFILDSYKERLRWKLTKCEEVKGLVETLERIAGASGAKAVKTLEECRILACTTLKKFKQDLEN